MAIAATAIVHFLNNVFKFLLMKKSVNWEVVKPFGLAAIPAAFLGAWLLGFMTDIELMTYEMFGRNLSVGLLNLVFGLVLIAFALIELIPSWSLAFSKRSLWVGGVISGFFGGLSGHQGALRSAFLIKYQLAKETFIATGIVIALVVDVVRTSVYAWDYPLNELDKEGWIIILASLGSALVGAITGKLLLKKIKIKALTLFVSIAMLIFGLALASGMLNKNHEEESAQKTIQRTEANFYA